MKRKVSEFAYGFVLTHELVNHFGFLPTDLPNGARKGPKSKELQIARGYPLFLQFKASEFLKRRNAGESKLVGLPYFRFALHRKVQSNQHQALIELEKKGAAVFYATPKIHEAVNLNGAFFDHQVVALSMFVSPRDIGELPDNEVHSVVFSGRSGDVYFCPRKQPLDRVIQGEAFSTALAGRLSTIEPAELNDEFFHGLAAAMVSIVSPNRRIFDELSRGKLKMTSSTFANYLARTLFDCDLLIVPA